MFGLVAFVPVAFVPVAFVPVALEHRLAAITFVPVALARRARSRLDAGAVRGPRERDMSAS
jgi:hypothetical protein